MGLNSLLGSLATKFLTGSPSQAPITRNENNQQANENKVQANSGNTDLSQINSAINNNAEQAISSEQNRREGNNLAATIEPSPNVASTVQTTKAETTPTENKAETGIKLEISQKAVDGFITILPALKDLAKKLLPELNLKELANTAKPILQALSQASSNNPASTPTPATNLA